MLSAMRTAASLIAALFILKPEGGDQDLEAVFIRAPIIRRVGENAKVLARYREDPVLVEQGRHLVATFHPELTGDSRVHEMFLDKIERNA